MSRPTDSVTALAEVTALKSALHAIRGKAARADVAKAIKSGKELSAESRLRAFLAIGRAPTSDLIDEAILRTALSPEDCATFAQRLTLRASTLNAHQVLAALEKLLLEAREIDLPRVAAALARATKRWLSQRSKAKLTVESVEAFNAALERLLHRSREKSRKRLPAKQEAKFIATLVELVSFSLLESASTKSTVARTVVGVLSVAQEVAEEQLENAVDESVELEAALDALVVENQRALGMMAANGETVGFGTHARRMLGVRAMAPKTTSWLQAIYADRSTVPPAIQLVVSDLLGLASSSDQTIGVGRPSADGVRTLQLASALIRAWSASTSSPQAREAFGELSAVLQNFFGIQLKGSAGEITSFNRLIHEYVDPNTPPGELVRVLRPRVELAENDSTSVLIKALVEIP